MVVIFGYRVLVFGNLGLFFVELFSESGELPVQK